MTPKSFRRIALSLPEATEGSHFSNADFRIAGKIFATLALEHQGYGVLLLTPEPQSPQAPLALVAPPFNLC